MAAGALTGLTGEKSPVLSGSASPVESIDSGPAPPVRSGGEALPVRGTDLETRARLRARIRRIVADLELLDVERYSKPAVRRVLQGMTIAELEAERTAATKRLMEPGSQAAA